MNRIKEKNEWFDSFDDHVEVDNMGNPLSEQQIEEIMEKEYERKNGHKLPIIKTEKTNLKDNPAAIRDRLRQKSCKVNPTRTIPASWLGSGYYRYIGQYKNISMYYDVLDKIVLFQDDENWYPPSKKEIGDMEVFNIRWFSGNERYKKMFMDFDFKNR